MREEAGGAGRKRGHKRDKAGDIKGQHEGTRGNARGHEGARGNMWGREGTTGDTMGAIGGQQGTPFTWFVHPWELHVRSQWDVRIASPCLFRHPRT